MSRGCDSFAVLVREYIASSCDSGPVSLKCARGAWVSSGGERETQAGQGRTENDERGTEPGVSGESTKNRSHQSKRTREGVGREGMRERAASRECERKERWGRTREGIDDVGGGEEEKE
jgi:hypothetical protein